MSEIIEKGKELAFLLRHDKDYDFPSDGWRTIDDLVENHGFTKEMIEKIVETNNKKRFEYNDDKTCVRARQGHSINVDVDLEEVVPTEPLYHGTSVKSVVSIKKEGIKPNGRLYVHLSSDFDTAKTVGQRHGIPFVFELDTDAMVKDGIKFYKSRNNVWLTEYVAPKYLKSKF